VRPEGKERKRKIKGGKKVVPEGEKDDKTARDLEEKKGKSSYSSFSEKKGSISEKT